MAKAQKQEKTMEAALWEAANKLRGAVEPAEYKHVVLSLIFLKYASDKFDGDIQLDEESTAYRWISFDEVMGMEMASSQKRRVQDVIAYYRSGQKKMG